MQSALASMDLCLSRQCWQFHEDLTALSERDKHAAVEVELARQNLDTAIHKKNLTARAQAEGAERCASA